MTDTATTPEVTIVPANEASWEDLQAVLGTRGSHSGCWCQRFKIRGREWDSGSVPVGERARRLREQTGCDHPESGTTSGLVAYLGGEPVGWCAVEPRTAYVRLGRVPWAGRAEDGAADRVAELGVPRFETSLPVRRFDVAMLEGDASRAEVAAREACETAEATAALGNFMWYCCNLAQALLELGREDEAAQWLEHGRETAPSEERPPQMLWRQVRGKLLARRGELEEGERLAREAVALAEETDMLNAHADALVDLAEVLALAGQDARAELEQALALYERKGNLVMAERARSRLAEVKAPR